MHVCSFLSLQKSMNVSCSSSEIDNFALEWKKNTHDSEKSDDICMEIQEFRNTMPFHIKITLGHSVSNKNQTVVHSVI